MKYTHKDPWGMLWRFEGLRPVSQIADEVMAAVVKERTKTVNNNTKKRWNKLTKAQRVALAKAGEVRKSKHAKVAWSR